MEDECKVELNCRTIAIMERDHDVMFAELGGTGPNDREPMAWMRRGIPDHEALGSGKALVIDLSFNVE